MLVYILSSFRSKRNFNVKSIIGCYFFKHRILVYDYMLQEWEYESTVSVTISQFLIECGSVWTDSFLFNCK